MITRSLLFSLKCTRKRLGDGKGKDEGERGRERKGGRGRKGGEMKGKEGKGRERKGKEGRVHPPNVHQPLTPLYTSNVARVSFIDGSCSADISSDYCRY